MNNLLKILPLMNAPDAMRQSLLRDALAGSSNPMVGFVAARQASDAAAAAVAAGAGAASDDPQQARVDAEAILAHLYRRPGTGNSAWAARLAGLRAAIEAKDDDDDKRHWRAFEHAGDEFSRFMLQLLNEDAGIDPAILEDFQSMNQEVRRVIDRLAERHKVSAGGIDVPGMKIAIEFSLSPIPGRALESGRVPNSSKAKGQRRAAGPAKPLPRRK